MTLPTLPDDSLMGITRLLMANAETYFGSRDVVTITPTALIHGRNSTILKSKVLFPDGYMNIFIKVAKLSKTSSKHRQVVQERVRTECDVARLICDGFKEHVDDYSCIRPIACFPDKLAFVTEECPGQRFMSLLENKARFFHGRTAENRLARYCYLSGRWLRILREKTETDDRPFVPGELVKYVDVRLQRLVDSPVIPFDHELQEGVLEFFESQEPFLKDTDLATCGVTGDFVPANVLAHENKITVLDFGMYRHGSIYEDLAQYYQHLAFFMQKPIYRRKRISRLQQEFLKGYDPNFDVANPLFKLFRVRAVINRLAATAVRKWDNLPLHVRLFNRATWRGQLEQLRNLEDW